MNINPNAIMQQAINYQSLNEYDQALALIKPLLKYYPKHPDINHFYANLLNSSGHSTQSIPYFKKALKGKSKDAQCWNDLGSAYKALQRPKDAINSFDKALRLAPGTAEILVNIGSVHQQVKNYSEAIKFLRRAIKQRPNYPVAHLMLGNVQKKSALFNDAIDSYKNALTFNPQYFQAHYNLALVLSDTEQHIQALDYCAKALTIKPDYYAALALSGQINEQLGNIQKAKDFYFRCIACQPESTEAYWNLANLDHEVFAEPIVKQMLSLLKKQLTSESRVFLLFALAKAMEQKQNYDSSFDYLQQANQLKRQQLDIDPSTGRLLVEQLRLTFTNSIMSRIHNYTDTSISPIFIVGMPRSGTSLVEQFLAGHSEIADGGELETSLELLLDEVPKLTQRDWQSGIKELKEIHLQQLADGYCESNRALVNSKAFFTDKLPFNFAMIGFLSLIFPKAKFIHVFKNPLDACLSCYKQLFTIGQEFSYSLEDLASYHQEYTAIMQHWSKMIPDKIHHISYENLVGMPELQMKRMLSFLQLPWQQDCLQFHQRKGLIKTASAGQVRRGLYKTSINRWKNYEQQLAVIKGKLTDSPFDS